MSHPCEPSRHSLLEPEQQRLADEAVWSAERSDAELRVRAYQFAKAESPESLARRVCLFQGYLIAMRRPTPFTAEFAREIAASLDNVYEAHERAIDARKAVVDRADG